MHSLVLFTVCTLDTVHNHVNTIQVLFTDYYEFIGTFYCQYISFYFLLLRKYGVVHAWVGQKLVNSNILRVFSYRS